MAEIPDHLPTFEGPPKLEGGMWCWHEQYTVNEQQRRVTCVKCAAILDPFEIVRDQARKVRVRENVDQQISEKRKLLHSLEVKERNAKSRIRNAKKKDADAAVAAALAKVKENHERAINGLRAARMQIADSMKRLGAEDDHDPDAWKRGERA